MSNLLTIPELAEKLNVKVPTVRNWVAKRKIAYIKLPQGIRFKEEWVNNWLDTKTVKPKSKY